MLKLSLPIPLQNLTLQIQGILPRTLDRMQLPRPGQVINILPAAAQDLRSFSHIHNTMHNEVPEVGNTQGHLLADAVQRGCTDTQVHIPLNAMASWLEIDGIEVILVPEQYLKRRCIFVALFDAALLHRTITEEHQ